jgi:hypothetical protein
MYLLTKEADELAIVFAPDEKLRLGDALYIDGIVAQVVDIQFADLPGVLEHILRKSLISKVETKEHIQPEVRSIVDSLADQRLAVAKIRGRIVEVSDHRGGRRKLFKTGLSEFNVSRAKTEIKVLGQDELFEALNLHLPDLSDFGKTLSSEPKSFEIPAEKLGINLITGMKGSGKSYSAKRLLLKLIERGVLTLVFDLNAEYLNLWKAEDGKPNQYASVIKVLTPRLKRAQANEQPLSIPLNEVDYDDFHFPQRPPGHTHIPAADAVLEVQGWSPVRPQRPGDLHQGERPERSRKGRTHGEGGGRPGHGDLRTVRRDWHHYRDAQDGWGDNPESSAGRQVGEKHHSRVHTAEVVSPRPVQSRGGRLPLPRGGAALR